MLTALFATLALAQTSGNPAVRVETPEAAYRTFILAMMKKDEATLRSVTLPTETEDFAWLLRGESPPPEALEEIEAELERQPIRKLKAGDTFTLPGGRRITFGPANIGEDRTVLVPEGSPLPTKIRKVAGRWRVDPRPVIAGRKAADAARKKAESASK